MPVPPATKRFISCGRILTAFTLLIKSEPVLVVKLLMKGTRGTKGTPFSVEIFKASVLTVNPWKEDANSCCVLTRGAWIDAVEILDTNIVVTLNTLNAIVEKTPIFAAKLIVDNVLIKALLTSNSIVESVEINPRFTFRTFTERDEINPALAAKMPVEKNRVLNVDITTF